MPQLNKENLMLTFTFTWMTLYLISKLIKNLNLGSTPPTDQTTYKPSPWHWPYT